MGREHPLDPTVQKFLSCLDIEDILLVTAGQGSDTSGRGTRLLPGWSMRWEIPQFCPACLPERCLAGHQIRHIRLRRSCDCSSEVSEVNR